MAIRRLNYTGRKRLRQVDTRVTIHESNDGAAKFDADLELDGYNLPGDAPVFVEAYRQTSWMRFRFGTVARAGPQDNLILDEFDSPEGVLFRVRITSPTDPGGLLLAEADRIRPRRPDEVVEDKRIPLLPVKSDDDLGNQVFRVDFSDRPLLLVNTKIGDWGAVAREPVFVSLVYPAALRGILTRILCFERYFDTDDSKDWRSQWLLFATLLPGVPEPPGEGEEDTFDDWVDGAVASFCRQFGMMERFSRYWTGEGES